MCETEIIYNHNNNTTNTTEATTYHHQKQWQQQQQLCQQFVTVSHGNQNDEESEEHLKKTKRRSRNIWKGSGNIFILPHRGREDLATSEKFPFLKEKEKLEMFCCRTITQNTTLLHMYAFTPVYPFVHYCISPCPDLTSLCHYKENTNPSQFTCIIPSSSSSNNTTRPCIYRFFLPKRAAILLFFVVDISLV